MNGWVVVGMGGSDVDSPYDVQINTNDPVKDTSFCGSEIARVVRPSGPNGSPIGFRVQYTDALDPDYTTASSPSQSGLFPLFDAASPFELPLVNSYTAITQSGKVYLIARAQDGDGATDGRFQNARDAQQLVDEIDAGINVTPERLALRSRVLTFFVNRSPAFLYCVSGFVPQPPGLSCNGGAPTDTATSSIACSGSTSSAPTRPLRLRHASTDGRRTVLEHRAAHTGARHRLVYPGRCHARHDLRRPGGVHAPPGHRSHAECALYHRHASQAGHPAVRLLELRSAAGPGTLRPYRHPHECRPAAPPDGRHTQSVHDLDRAEHRAILERELQTMKRLRHSFALVGLVALGVTLLVGCSDKKNPIAIPNQLPTVQITAAPIDTNAVCNPDPQRSCYSITLDWIGNDPDGHIDHYIYAVDPPEDPPGHGDTLWIVTPDAEKRLVFKAPNPTEGDECVAPPLGQAQLRRRRGRQQGRDRPARGPLVLLVHGRARRHDPDAEAAGSEPAAARTVGPHQLGGQRPRRRVQLEAGTLQVQGARAC
jgi:hypothetical protein